MARRSRRVIHGPLWIFEWLSGSDRLVTRPRGDARAPCADRRGAGERKTAFFRDVRVGVQPDVGQRELVGDQELPALKPLLEHVERREPQPALLGELLAELSFGLVQRVQPEARR